MKGILKERENKLELQLDCVQLWEKMDEKKLLRKFYYLETNVILFDHPLQKTSNGHCFSFEGMFIGLREA